MEAITTTSDVSTKINIINIEKARDIPGGASIELSSLIDANVIQQATPLSAPTTGVRKVCKQGVVLTGSTTTVINVTVGDHNFKVGDFIGTKVGGLAYAITDITATATVDAITVGTAIDTPATGAYIYQMSEETTETDATFNIAYANDTCTGLTDDATSTEIHSGPEDQETEATIVGTIDGAGNVSVIVTGADLTGTPLTIAVAVEAGDDKSAVAEKIRSTLDDTAAITNDYVVGGIDEKVSLTNKNDASVSSLKNTPFCISGRAFKVDQTKVIEAIPAYMGATVVAGVIGNEYVDLLKNIDEVSY